MFRLATQPFNIRKTLLPNRHHRRRRIADHHMPIRAAQQTGDITGPPGQIDQQAGLLFTLPHQPPLPPAMNPQTHQVVHQIVAAGDSGKYPADAPPALGRRDAPRAKAGNFVLRNWRGHALAPRKIARAGHRRTQRGSVSQQVASPEQAIAEPGGKDAQRGGIDQAKSAEPRHPE